MYILQILIYIKFLIVYQLPDESMVDVTLIIVRAVKRSHSLVDGPGCCTIFIIELSALIIIIILHNNILLLLLLCV